MPKVLSQSGFAHLALLLFLIISLVIGLFVIKDPTNLFPKAAQDNPDTPIISENGEVTVSGKVFVDLDKNNQQITSFEWGLEGVKVYGPLVRGEALPRSTVTDKDGNWSMRIPDFYLESCQRCNVIYVIPELPGLRAINPNIEVPLVDGRVAKVKDFNFSFEGIYSVRGTVYQDLNNNNRRDDNESGLPGVLITVGKPSSLIPFAPDLLGYTHTDDNGSYIIYGIPPREESLRIEVFNQCVDEYCWFPSERLFYPGKADRNYVIDIPMSLAGDNLGGSPYPYSSPDMNPSPNETPYPSSSPEPCRGPACF